MLEKFSFGLLVFIVTFWIVIFMILPFKYESQDNVVIGTSESAPKHTHFKLKFLITAFISFIFTILILVYAEQGLESLSNTEWKF